MREAGRKSKSESAAAEPRHSADHLQASCSCLHDRYLRALGMRCELGQRDGFNVATQAAIGVSIGDGGERSGALSEAGPAPPPAIADG